MTGVGKSEGDVKREEKKREGGKERKRGGKCEVRRKARMKLNGGHLGSKVARLGIRVGAAELREEGADFTDQSGGRRDGL